ncbi:Two-component system histidine kinase DccS [hydrothermal vent metagenome]|uniref:Two-component system histidine kinase DccS n=1 Tax=hydrothermal vent metagenome TaxID=652676 RepID=A0A1W1C9T8_9ZZZZ
MYKEIHKIVSEFLQCQDIKIENTHSSSLSKAWKIEENHIYFYLSKHAIVYRNCKHIPAKESIKAIYKLLKYFDKTAKEIKKSTQQNFISSALEHEIKNILSNSKLSVEMLKDYALEEEDREKLLQQAFSSLSEAVDFFEELLLWKKFNFEKNKHLLQNETFELSAVLKELKDEFIYAIRQKNLHIEIQCQNITLLSNRIWIKRALHNLISNAIKYNCENGKIILLCKKSSKEISISIQNEGKGIPQKEMTKIFSVFHQSPESLQGFGIGLALVKSIVDTFDGNISVQSTPNKDTLFTLKLPLIRKNKKTKHPLLRIGAAGIALFTLAGFQYPVVPHLHFFKNQGSLSVAQIDKSIFKSDAKSNCFIWHTTTWSKDKEYLAVYLKNGFLEADIHQQKIDFITPSFSFKNMGTQFSAIEKKEAHNVGVYNGVLSFKKENIGKGYAAYRKNGATHTLPLLSPPQQIHAYNPTKNTNLEITFEKMEEAIAYRIEIARDEHFIQNVTLKTTTLSHLSLAIPQDGIYYLKIQAIDSNHIPGLPAKVTIRNITQVLKAQKAREVKNYNKAITYLKESIKNFHYASDLPYVELGWTYYLSSHYEHAIESLKKALEIEQKEDTLLKLGLAYLQAEKTVESNKVFLELLKKNPYNIDALWAYSRLKIDAKKYPEAKEILLKVLQINPQYPLANYDMAEINFNLNNIQEAKKYLELEKKYNTQNNNLIQTFENKLKQEEQ